MFIFSEYVDSSPPIRILLPKARSLSISASSELPNNNLGINEVSLYEYLKSARL